MQGIYEIVNTADGKASSYIGSSIHIERRLEQHRRRLCGDYHYNPRLQTAWNKWGEGAFELGVLEIVKDGNMLRAMEQEYLDDYFDRGSCYNVARDVTAFTRGLKFSLKHRRKLSKALKGNQNNKGRYPSEESKRKMSESHKGQLAWNKGKSVSEETLRWMREVSSRPYPAFYNERTGDCLPAGRNLKALCQEYGLCHSAMCRVKNGKVSSHKGWILASRGK